MTNSLWDLWLPFRHATRQELLLNAIGLVACVGAGAVQPLMNIPFGSITNDLVYFTQGDETTADATNRNILIFCYLAVGSFIATYVYVALWVYTGETISNRLRNKCIKHILSQELAYYEDGQALTLISEMQPAFDAIQSAISEKMPLNVLYISCAVTGFIVALVKSWKLGLSLLSMLPALLLLGFLLTRYGFAYMGKVMGVLEPAAGMIQEALFGLVTIRILGAEGRMLSDLIRINKQAMSIAHRRNLVWGGCMGGITFVIYSGYSLCFAFGGKLFRGDDIQAGNLITVFLSIMMGSFALAQVPTSLNAFLLSARSAKKLEALLSRRPLVSPSTPQVSAIPPNRSISFNNVDFTYPSRPDVPVLTDFSLSLPIGKTIGIVGPSGAGKSTLAALMLSLYTPTAGSIRLDDVDISTLDPEYLRGELVSSVLQEPKLFSTTIRANVALGLRASARQTLTPDQIAERVQAACRQAQAHDFIMQLPGGYDTQVGEAGEKLSGGQRARVAIARALVRRALILLLDEATANLDTISEQAFVDALSVGSDEAPRTTIVIAHRLSTILAADLICVVDGGKVVAQGSHDDLLADKEGLYHRLFAVQAVQAASKGGEEEKESTKTSTDVPPIKEKEEVEVGTDSQTQDQDSKGASTWHNIRLLVKTCPQMVWYAWVGIVGSIVAGLLYPAFAIIYALAYSTFGLEPENASKQNDNALWFFLCAIAGGLGVFVQWYYLGRASDHIGVQFRYATFRRLLRADMTFFDEPRNSSGSLASIVNNSPTRLSSFMGTGMGTFVASLSTLVGGAIVGLVYSWKLGLVNIAVLPLTLGTAIVRLKVVDARESKLKQQHEPANRLASEAVSQLKTVMALSAESEIYRQYLALLDVTRRKSTIMAFASTLLFALSQTNMYLVVALGFWYGSRLVYQGEITSRAFFAVFTAVVSGSFQAVNVLSQAPELSQARGAVDDIARLLEAPLAKSSGNEPFINGDITFDHVDFAYPNQESLSLKDLSLELSHNRLNALCGPSGSGKSTIFRLIQRLYRPKSGVVRIGPTNVDDIREASYCAHTTFVAQEPVLFNMSILDNMLLGLPDGEVHAGQMRERVYKALESASLATFVTGLPDGLDTILGSKGAALSGGQRQRLVLARALVEYPFNEMMLMSA